jgi:hypothetical protein
MAQMRHIAYRESKDGLVCVDMRALTGCCWPDQLSGQQSSVLH